MEHTKGSCSGDQTDEDQPFIQLISVKDAFGVATLLMKDFDHPHPSIRTPLSSLRIKGC